MSRLALALRCVVLLLLLRPAAAQDVDAFDPLSVVPEDCRICVDVADLGRFLTALRSENLWAGLPDAATAEARAGLERLAAIGARRVVFGAEAGLGKSWVLLVSADDAERALKGLRELVPAAKPLRVGKWAGLGSDDDAVDRLASVAAQKKPSVLRRDGFAAARKAFGGGDVFVHVDLAGTRWLRGGAGKAKDLGQALLAAHVLGAAATADAITARVDLDGGLRVRAGAPMRALGPDRAFAAPSSRPGAAPPIPAPPGTSLRLALRRDLAAFWARRESFVADDARTGVAEFQNNLSILLGGLAAEEVFAGLGDRFDLYVGPPPAENPAPRHAFPTAAVVVDVPDAALRTELLLGFQTTLGVVNAEAAQQRRPRYLIETADHRGARLVTSRFLPELLPDADDDRLQLRPTLAFAGSRMILATHPDAARALLDAAAQPAAPADGRTEDRLEFDGAAAARAVRSAAGFLAAQEALKKGGAPEEAAATIEFLAGLVARVERASIAFGVAPAEKDAATATFELDLRAPSVLPVKAGAPR
jgi:hypothetical protein